MTGGEYAAIVAGVLAFVCLFGCIAACSKGGHRDGGVVHERVVEEYHYEGGQEEESAVPVMTQNSYNPNYMI